MTWQAGKAISSTLGRAGGRCEYCRIQQAHVELTHHMEHIVARKHGGSVISGCANDRGVVIPVSAMEHARDAPEHAHAAIDLVRERFPPGLGREAAGVARDRLMAELWHAASRGDPSSAPRVRELFGLCVAFSLGNARIARHLAEGRPGWTVAALEASPIVRVEFEQAIVLGRLGESLAAARHKNWGAFLGVRPLDPGDPVDASRLVYIFKDESAYQRRFEQRGRLRAMLGKDYAALVNRAMGSGKGDFLRGLSEDERGRVRARTGLEPGRFWRVAKGREFADLPRPPRQQLLFEVD